ncbi:MAG: glycosyltransferase [Candidatus Sumerlaeaceae bacterium]
MAQCLTNTWTASDLATMFWFWLLLAAGAFIYWVVAIVSGFRGARTVSFLSKLPLPDDPATLPKLSVVVPARNEEAGIRACLESLLAQEYPNLEILVMEDRSTDRTHEIADEIAARSNGRLVVEHITECPEGWLGKCNALSTGAAKATGEYILFADGDVIFEPTTLARAVHYIRQENADMLAGLPDILTATPGERCMILTFAQCFSIAFSASRAQDDSSRAFIGVGAFNMVRAAHYRKVHGHRFLRLQVIDDVGLGKLFKLSGGRLRVVYGTGMIKVRWQTGLANTIKGLEKNGFASFNYSVLKTLIASFGLLYVYWWPWFGIFFGPLAPRVICGATALVLQPLLGVALNKFSNTSPIYAFSGPIGALFMFAAMMRSMFVTLRQGGIRWRDTFYALKELRQFKI